MACGCRPQVAFAKARLLAADGARDSAAASILAEDYFGEALHRALWLIFTHGACQYHRECVQPPPARRIACSSGEISFSQLQLSE